MYIRSVKQEHKNAFKFGKSGKDKLKFGTASEGRMKSKIITS